MPLPDAWLPGFLAEPDNRAFDYQPVSLPGVRHDRFAEMGQLLSKGQLFFLGEPAFQERYGERLHTASNA